MARSLPPLTWFRAFECAARHLSFTGAAREMNVTQSAISQHVRLLEKRLGTAVFVRKARGIALTEAGRRLLPYVSGAMADLATATEIFDPHRGDDVLEVACSSSFARLWLSRNIGAFLKKHPGLDIRIVSAIWPDDYSKVESSVQIRYGSPELVGDGAQRLLNDTMVPVCHPDLAALFQDAKRRAEVPLIHTMGTANTWARWSKESGIDVSSASSLSVDSDELALELAENARGVALCGLFLCRSLLNARRLSMPMDHTLSSDENYYVAALEGRGENATASDFVGWLFRSVEDEVRRSA